MFFHLAIWLNILVLIIYKITDTGNENFSVVTTLIPLGYSYIILQFLSYQIEVNRKRIAPEKNLLLFANYITLFPKITQGPIERPYNILEQLRTNIHSRVSYDGLRFGSQLIIFGLFKKIVIADRLGIYVNTVYNNYTQHSGITLLAATLFFAIQVYADFSGYSDMVVGLGKIMNIDFMNNFNKPYLSTSIKELWTRWHISLSQWLRDYIFLPLSFRLKAKFQKKKYFGIKADNIIYTVVTLVTFSICGLWHGLYGKYLIWGWIISLYLILPFIFKKRIQNFNKLIKLNKKSFLYLFFKSCVIILLMSVTWIFFRAADIHSSFEIIKSIAKLSGPMFYGGNDNSVFVYSLFGVFVLGVYELQYEFFKGKMHIFNNKNIFIRYASFFVILILIMLLGVFDGGEII